MICRWRPMPVRPGSAVHYGAHPAHELAALNPLYAANSVPNLHAWLLDNA